MVSRPQNFYMAELSSLPADRGLNYKHGAAWIVCPNPKHSGGMERSGSMKIKVEPGKYQGCFHCFGCKVSGGWNKLITEYKLKLKKVSAGAKSANVGFSFKKFEEAEATPDFTDMIPWSPNHDWRGMSAEILIKFDTRVMNQRERVYLIFPVYIYDEPRGYIRANLEPPKRDPVTGKKELSYINMKGTWTHECLFGFELARKRAAWLKANGKTVVLFIVEGPRDTMNIAQHNGVVVGLIGSAPSSRKIQLILELDPDVIIIATDGDDAGNNAAQQLMHGKKDDDTGKVEFEGLGQLIPCIRLNFKDGRDPADLKRQKVKALIRLARERI